MALLNLFYIHLHDFFCECVCVCVCEIVNNLDRGEPLIRCLSLSQREAINQVPFYLSSYRRFMRVCGSHKITRTEGTKLGYGQMTGWIVFTHAYR
jgi:hypothetical protein